MLDPLLDSVPGSPVAVDMAEGRIGYSDAICLLGGPRRAVLPPWLAHLIWRVRLAWWRLTCRNAA